MAIGRNWLTTLFPASFKAVPFQTEKDEENGGRRVVAHQFPMRDDPFLEDLGEDKREYEITAYVASDSADSEAQALLAVLAQRGPGTLVLPTHGPLLVRCVSFRRDRSKDKAGYIGITAKFLRQGAASPLVSLPFLANLVFVASENIGAAVATFARNIIKAVGQPDYVTKSATDALQDGAAILDDVRLGTNIDPVVSGKQRAAIQAFYDAATAMVTDGATDGDAIAGLVVIARALGDGMDGATAAAAFEEVIETATVEPKVSFSTPAARAADGNRLAVYLMIRLAAATAYAEGIARAEIGDRQTAITLRANAAEYFEAILSEMSAYDADLYRAVLTLRGTTVDYLSRAILDRAPIIDVGANRRMPSLWWAHRLYQDPTRSRELVERARVSHPSMMPLDFEALSR